MPLNHHVKGVVTALRVVAIMNRMPVILPDDACDLWLDPGIQKADAICDLLKPF